VGGGTTFWEKLKTKGVIRSGVPEPRGTFQLINGGGGCKRGGLKTGTGVGQEKDGTEIFIQGSNGEGQMSRGEREIGKEIQKKQR